MRALILAAGMGKRMGAETPSPKVLLEFAGKTPLARHLENLRRGGVEDIVIGIGYRAEAIQAELSRLGAGSTVRTVLNEEYDEGSVVTLWTLRDELARGGDVLIMDADVLYDHRLLVRLLDTRHPTCFLLDREIEPGEEPVKICVRDWRMVEFRKQVDPDLAYDYHGESVGFFRFAEEDAARLAGRTEEYVDRGITDAPHEEVLRDLLLADAGASFGFEDVTGLPWMEIDFPEDVRRAEEQILPRLTD